MSATLTAKQAECLAFIQSYQAERGIAPSYREIASGIGLASTGNVHRIVEALQERGALRKPYGLARCFELLAEHGAEHHLRAVLGSFSANGIAFSNSPAVVAAMQFLGAGERA